MDILTIIKVGGKIVEDSVFLDKFLTQFRAVEGSKILVHGGGRSATELAAKLGIESKFVEGRRITDEDTLKIAVMTYAGLVNKNIVARLQAKGINALGLTGADANVILSDKRPVKEIDYGFAGDVKKVNSTFLHRLLQAGIVPVLAPLSHNGRGLLLNTNADTIAAETAKALSSFYDVRLVYCFEKKGVLRNSEDDSSLVRELDYPTFLEYKADGTIKEGMVPKLKNAFDAIESGVKEVVITNTGNINSKERTIIK